MPKTFSAALVAVVLIVGAPAGAVEDLRIAAFAGHWVGSGVAHNDLSEYFKLTIRDLDARIVLKGDGFELGWTTVLREGGTPEEPRIRHKSTVVEFVPAGRAGVFRGSRGVDPLSGTPFIWARIRGQTLTVHSLVIDADGSYEMHTYDRTLVAQGMELEFTRVRDGEPTRSVSGKLIKSSY